MVALTHNRRRVRITAQSAFGIKEWAGSRKVFLAVDTNGRWGKTTFNEDG